MRHQLEVCIASLEGALAAERGGADRIELNAALSLDGLTPSAGMLSCVRAAVRVPIIVMIRPRPGEFTYGEPELNVMEEDIRRLAVEGAAGFAVGPLTATGEVDVAALERLRRAAGGRAIVFHRAFDVVRDRSRAMDALIDAGVGRVLTSGGARCAVEGVSELANLIEKSAGRIEVLPGGGITPGNAAEILRLTGCTQVHGSFRSGGVARESGSGSASGVAFAPQEAECDERVVRAVRGAIDAVVSS